MRAYCCMGVCDPEPEAVQLLVTMLGARVIQDHGLVATLRGGIIERGTRAWEHLRERAPGSTCWALLDADPELVLVVAMADAPVLN